MDYEVMFEITTTKLVCVRENGCFDEEGGIFCGEISTKNGDYKTLEEKNEVTKLYSIEELGENNCKKQDNYNKCYSIFGKWVDMGAFLRIVGEIVIPPNAQIEYCGNGVWKSDRFIFNGEDYLITNHGNLNYFSSKSKETIENIVKGIVYNKEIYFFKTYKVADLYRLKKDKRFDI